MSPSPLRPLAAPVQDAPRKLSTPQQPAQRQSGLHQSGLHRPSGHPATNRRSNPALQSTTGESGFDGRLQQGGRPQLADTRPQLSLPGSAGSADGASATQETSSAPPLDRVHKIFDQTSKTLEGILKSLGYNDLPEIEDSTARMQQRSDYLGSLLTATPELADQISTGHKMQLYSLSKLMDGWTGLPAAEVKAIGSVHDTTLMACAGWQPPPGER